MAGISFSRFRFKVKSDGDEDVVVVTYGKRYSFELSIDDFRNIDPEVVIEEKRILFPKTKDRPAEHKLDLLLSKGLRSMTHLLNGKKVVFIDEESGIPLIGAVDFGVVDRGTNILEVKPLTGCNLNCVYCSVDEGVNKKTSDYLVDDSYLVSVCESLAATKKHPVEFNIGPHGEPLLYPFIIDLIKGLSNIDNCKVISINTNGTLLTKEFIDDLKEAGLTRINWSLNTTDEEVASKLAQKPFSTSKALDLIAYANSKGLYVQIAPLVVPGYNDDIEKHIAPLVELSTKLNSPYPTIGIQKYLRNKGGRNPVAEISFEEFFKGLKPLEDRFNVRLTPDSLKNYNPYGIFEDTKLEKPFKKIK
jgi:uncharacterized Fe-S cluster-containing radical SAM superfamily enzyme